MIERIIRSAAILSLAFVVLACGDKPEESGSDATKPDSAAAVNTADSWKGTELASTDGGFSLTLPSGFPSPTQSSQPLTTAVGPLTMTMYTTSQDDRNALMVAYLDYPEQAFEAPVEAMLDGARDSALKSLNAKLEKQESVTLNGHPGRSMVLTGNSEGKEIYGRIDYYIVKPRMYQILFLTDRKDEMSEDRIQKSFSSFTLNEAAGKEAAGSVGTPSGSDTGNTSK